MQICGISSVNDPKCQNAGKPCQVQTMARIIFRINRVTIIIPGKTG